MSVRSDLAVGADSCLFQNGCGDLDGHTAISAWIRGL